LAAFAPGRNDWAAGPAQLDALRTSSGGALVAANLGGASAGAVRSTMREIGGVKVALVGVAVPRDARGAPSGLTIEDAGKALAEEAKKARAAGARIVVGLASLDRGEALRAVDAVPELDVLALGSTASDGDVNDAPQAPRFIGPTLVVQPSNHLTRVAIVDFYVRAEGRFADGSGLSQAAETTKLQADVDDLARRIVNWENNKNISQADLDAQKKRLADLRAKLAKASVPPPAPTGPFLRYSLVDVKQSLGSDSGVAASMKAFYTRVNEANAKKFAGRRATPPGKDEAQYVGVEVCKVCHTAAYDVWKKNDHSKAYKTLVDQSKEFNLDCVGCHVTGYEKIGGSTVTDVKELSDVQCETCHGAGSKHAADPTSGYITLLPEEPLCVSCHHEPHVSDFVYAHRQDQRPRPRQAGGARKQRASQRLEAARASLRRSVEARRPRFSASMVTWSSARFGSRKPKREGLRVAA
jgi:Cytochrome c554 and c-prime